MELYYDLASIHGVVVNMRIMCSGARGLSLQGLFYSGHDDNNIDTNSEDSVDGAVILRVHLLNIERHQAAADPRTKSTNLDHESACRLLLSTSTVTTQSKG